VQQARGTHLAAPAQDDSSVGAVLPRNPAAEVALDIVDDPDPSAGEGADGERQSTRRSSQVQQSRGPSDPLLRDLCVPSGKRARVSLRSASRERQAHPRPPLGQHSPLRSSSPLGHTGDSQTQRRRPWSSGVCPSSGLDGGREGSPPRESTRRARMTVRRSRQLGSKLQQGGGGGAGSSASSDAARSKTRRRLLTLLRRHVDSLETPSLQQLAS
jgi:hypothetical protein